MSGYNRGVTQGMQDLSLQAKKTSVESELRRQPPNLKHVNSHVTATPVVTGAGVLPHRPAKSVLMESYAEERAFVQPVEASGCTLPTTSELNMKGSIPFEATLPYSASIPTEGDFPVRANVHIDGQLRLVGSIPLQMSLPIHFMVPIHGDLPLEGLIPLEGSLPICGSIPVEGIIPVHGNIPIDGNIPLGAALQVEGQAALGGALGTAAPAVSSAATSAAVSSGQLFGRRAEKLPDTGSTTIVETITVRETNIA